MAWDEDLFPEQRDAASVDGGDHLVLAGPGTGKTFVLVRRIEFLIDELGVNPSEIQALTFSRAAAAEMRDRLVEQLGERGHRVRVSTLHSYALSTAHAQGCPSSARAGARCTCRALPASRAMTLQRVLEYLILSAALKDGRIDDLAIRALIELEQNGVGGRRIAAVTSRALQRSIRFSAAIGELRREGDKHLGVLFSAVDAILETARNLEPDDGERFDEWLTRVAERLALRDEAFEILVQMSAGVSDELVDLEMTESDGPEAASDEPFDYVSSLLDAMSNLSDAIPPQIEGRVTFTTMHGAKGLTADTVFVLQCEDELIPGDAEGIYLDETRRLLYVSLTRARRHLILTACNRRTGPQRFVGQQEVTRRTLSRFIADYGLEATTIEQYLAYVRSD